MGFEFKITEDLGGRQSQPLAREVIRVEQEATLLQNTWDGALPKDELMLLCRRLADKLGMDNIGDPSKNRKTVDLQKGRLEYVPNADNKQALDVKFRKGSEEIAAVIRPDKYGAGPRVCPSCGGDTSVKSSLAHNVIPQAVWAEIIDNALVQFVEIVRSGVLLETLDSNGKPLVKRFDTNKSLYEDSQKNILPLETLKTKSLKTIQQLKAINNYFAAQGGSQQQCPNCELIQSNATLIQRAKLEQEDSIIDDYFSTIPKTSFVGGQWNVLAANDKDGMDEALRKATLRQVGRYLQGLEDRIGKLYQDEENKGFTTGPGSVEPLIFLIWDHMGEFVWSFRAVALVMCGMPYTRTDTGLRTKSPMAHIFL